MASETDLIERVRRQFPTAAKGLRRGIGDDAAVLRPEPDKEWVVTTDAFLENVHFLRNVHPPDSAGYKALARATSDIAAMGGRARYFFLTMGLPDSLADSAWLGSFLGGMARAARRFKMALAGGDTTKFPTVVASLTIMGDVPRGRAILRSGAKPGDLLCVSGRLGEAELGLRLVLKKLHRHKRWAGLLRKNFYPEPRLALGGWLAVRGYANAMIDTSDGLSTDLAHICEASGVGAVVQATQIPLVRVPPSLKGRGFDALELALDGGEDYELLFTVPKRFSGRLPVRAAGVPLTIIGEITSSKKIVLVEESGRRRPLRKGGWDPFSA